MWNMERIHLMASEEMSFENVDGRTDDRRRIPVYTISSPIGSGELKIKLKKISFIFFQFPKNWVRRVCKTKNKKSNSESNKGYNIGRF